jgi:hypothetical protein
MTSKSIAKDLLSGLQGNQGASRFAHDGRKPKAGFIVSDPSVDSHRLVKPAHDLSLDEVLAWVRLNRSSGVVLGSWAHEGRWYLDVNDFLMSKNRAFLHAVIAKEKAIWSVIGPPHEIEVPPAFGKDPDLVSSAALLVTFTSLALDPNSPFGDKC